MMGPRYAPILQSDPGTFALLRGRRRVESRYRTRPQLANRTNETAMQIQLVTVPYRYDELNEGLGLGPKAMLDAGLEERLSAAHTVKSPLEAYLDPTAREEGRTAVNIGRLGASTSRLVAGA